MVIQLGENPWILIGLIFLELLFIIVPALISSRFEKKSFTDIIREMGFQKNKDLLLKFISGLGFGILIFFFSNYIIIFFGDIIIGSFFGVEFIKQAQEGIISTTPILPNLIQLIVLIVQQIIIIGPCEEAFFRGYLIKKCRAKLKLTYSIIISSICFTIYHVPPFLVPLSTIITFFGYYFILGLMLSLIFVYFDYSIIPCSITHSCFNVLFLII
ncbi:MAG: lysostaphin resistance A-like protein [Candidatus Hodarchaeota archaeon]